VPFLKIGKKQKAAFTAHFCGMRSMTIQICTHPSGARSIVDDQQDQKRVMPAPTLARVLSPGGKRRSHTAVKIGQLRG